MYDEENKRRKFTPFELFENLIKKANPNNCCVIWDLGFYFVTLYVCRKQSYIIFWPIGVISSFVAPPEFVGPQNFQHPPGIKRGVAFMWLHPSVQRGYFQVDWLVEFHLTHHARRWVAVYCRESCISCCCCLFVCCCYKQCCVSTPQSCQFSPVSSVVWWVSGRLVLLSSGRYCSHWRSEEPSRCSLLLYPIEKKPGRKALYVW